MEETTNNQTDITVALFNVLASTIPMNNNIDQLRYLKESIKSQNFFPDVLKNALDSLFDLRIRTLESKKTA